jgi:hypothetical protein
MRMTAFLPHPGFVLKPDLDRPTGQNRAVQKGFLYQPAEVLWDGPPLYPPA